MCCCAGENHSATLSACVCVCVQRCALLLSVCMSLYIYICMCVIVCLPSCLPVFFIHAHPGLYTFRAHDNNIGLRWQVGDEREGWRGEKRRIAAGKKRAKMERWEGDTAERIKSGLRRREWWREQKTEEYSLERCTRRPKTHSATISVFKFWTGT